MSGKKVKEVKKTFTVCMLPSFHKKIANIAFERDLSISEYITNAIKEKMLKDSK